jgi:hypothetical protein
VTMSSGNPQSWNGGTSISYTCPQYDNSVWDLNESYLEAKIRFQLKYDSASGTDQVIPLSGHSNAAIEKFFLSGLLEDAQISYGGTNIEQLVAPPDLYPLLHSVYTMMTRDCDKVKGEAECRNFYNDPVSVVGTTVANQIKLGYQDPAEFNITEDAEWPFNCALGSELGQIPTTRANETHTPFKVQLSNFELQVPNQITASHEYRRALIANVNNVGVPTAVGPGNNTYQDGVVNVVCKLAFPFCETGYKLPSNIPLKFNFRRSKSVSYTMTGDSQGDAVLSSGTAVTTAADVLRSTYQLTFNDLTLYLKRLTLSENQKMVLYESPSMIYDMPSWSGQTFDLNGSSFNQNVSFRSLPQVVFVGLVPRANISPVAGTHLLKFNSVYNTTPRNQLQFRQLYINSSLGRIPEGEPYAPADSAVSVGCSGSGRAYREFAKAVKMSDKCPIPYKTWLNCAQWFAFILNNSGSNPNWVASRHERSNINIQADLVGSASLADHVLVVVGAEMYEMLVTGLQNVALAV